MAEEKEIKYINRDFDTLKNSLIEFSKTYFPTTYTDFSSTSPGMMFIEMASYVGDVLSFYMDNQIQENFIQFARQDENLYTQAYTLGYKPKVTEASIAEVEVFQQVPSIVDANGDSVPDYNYALNFSQNTTLKSTLASANEFLIQDPIDFSFSSSLDPTQVSVYQVDDSGNPVFFLLKKTRKAISATINSAEFTFGSPEAYSTIQINDNNIIKILDVVDSDNKEWTEVDYLGQDRAFETIKNSSPESVRFQLDYSSEEVVQDVANDPNYAVNSSAVPNLLRLKKVPRRFVSRFKNSSVLELQFGSGVANTNDADITPNPNNVGIALPFKQDKLYTAFSPTNFTLTNTYGIAPSNTTLTVRYLTGGGVGANAPSNTISLITDTTNIKFNNFTGLDPTTAQNIFNSVAVNNPQAASGGKDGDSIEEIRINSTKAYQSQLRSVTQDDYLVRALSLPADYGSIAKVYAEPEKIDSLLPGEVPSTLNMFVLAYDANKNLVNASSALKQNLSTYLSQYRIINDSLKIKDAFVINIGINFDVITLPNFNSNEVINNCILALQDYFNIDKRQINQSIPLRDLFILLDKVKGVQTVSDVTIKNLTGEELGYSRYAYDILGATQNNIIYPSMDPSIFEIKFPEVDIKGRIINY